MFRQFENRILNPYIHIKIRNYVSEKSYYYSLHTRIAKLDVSMGELIAYFRGKCSTCGHQRIAHDEFGKCEGVMNKPCSSGCDNFNPE